MENGEDEEDEIFDSSNSQETTPVQLRSKSAAKKPDGRAPTMTIDVVRVGRPLKVLAMLLAVAALLMFGVAAASTSWMYTKYSRMGLFLECYNTSSQPEDSRLAQPKLLESETVCALTSCNITPLKICGALALATLLLTLLGVILLACGMCSMNVRRKTMLYNVTLVFFALACLCMTAVVIVYPIIFTQQFKDPKSRGEDHMHGGETSFGWSIVVGCCGVVALLAGISLLAFDKEGEEVIYRETIHQQSMTMEIPD